MSATNSVISSGSKPPFPEKRFINSNREGMVSEEVQEDSVPPFAQEYTEKSFNWSAQGILNLPVFCEDCLDGNTVTGGRKGVKVDKFLNIRRKNIELVVAETKKPVNRDVEVFSNRNDIFYLWFTCTFKITGYGDGGGIDGFRDFLAKDAPAFNQCSQVRFKRFVVIHKNHTFLIGYLKFYNVNIIEAFSLFCNFFYLF